MDYEDLGREFFKALTATSGIKLIDFKNFYNNSFHVTTELTCKNGDEEFRPDITVLINGMPLVFIEVKTRTNASFGSPLEGISASKLRHLVNLAQFYKSTHKDLPEDMRVDAIAVTVEDGKVSNIDHLKNVTL